VTDLAFLGTDTVVAAIGRNPGTSLIYRSTDGGWIWHESDIGLSSSSVRALATNVRGQVYAGTDGGVFRSVDAGRSWVPVNDGLSEQNISAMVMDKDGLLYVGTSSGQIYRTQDPTTVVPEPDGGVALGFVLEQNFPNPFNPLTAIRYRVPVMSHVSLKVYNVLGQEVATLVNNVKQRGNHEVTWSAGGFASGVYFSRLQAGSQIDTRKLVLLR
jgi:hypothetical protein